MRAVEKEATEGASTPKALQSGGRLIEAWRLAASWIPEQLTLRDATQHSDSRRIHLAGICTAIFLLALGVRLLHWHDSYAEIAEKGQWSSGIARHYQSEARRMLDEGGILFPNRPVDPGDARLILHPPGYSAMIAAIFALFGDSESRVRMLQIIFDALSAVLVFFIAAEVLPSAAAFIAAPLVALSPHLGYYSLWISPDTLCVLPILVAVYLIIKASKRPRLITMMAAGAMVGLSCWLRANALLLAPVLAIAAIVLIDKFRRLGYAATFVGATILIVSPITIRNWILFHHFIPISIAGGENLVVGIADFDKEGRFGMPASDGDAAVKDAEWHNRPDYAISAWLPDGVERDQARYVRGLQVIRSNPGWFLGVMSRRAFFMLRYNDRSRGDWPLSTSKVPIVSAEPPVMHSSESIDLNHPAWTASARELFTNGSVLSPEAEGSIESSSELLRVSGDASEFGDQFTCGPITVRPGTDYVLILQTTVDQGKAAAKVTTSDRRIALASTLLHGEEERKRLKRGKKGRSDDGDLAAPDPLASAHMLFASGGRNEVRLVISNNGPTSVRPVTEIAQAALYDLGETPYKWSRYPRAIIGGLQKNLFKTNAMLPLIIAGMLLLGLARQGRALAVLLAVPVYYICAQSVLSTEYRYILAIHYFLFVIAAVALFCAGKLIAQSAHRAFALQYLRSKTGL